MRVRLRSLATPLCAGALVLAGCGGAAEEPASSSSAPSPTTSATSDSTAATGASGSATLAPAVDADEGSAKEGSVRRFARAADRVCARSNRGAEPLERRAQALIADLKAAKRSGRRPDFDAPADFLSDAADHLDRDLARLRRLPEPRPGAGGERVLSFLDGYEQAVVTLERLAVELRAHDNLGEYLWSLKRFVRIARRNERTARSLGMEVCGTEKTSAR